MDKRNKTIIILSILTIIFTIMGGTFAYWNWASSNEQKTNVTFTVASGFSCSADGGGSITSNDKQLAPAACTNTTYAIKRTITVSPTITQPNKTIYLDLWLKVNNIGSGLSNSVNMKYALTTSPSDCITGVVAHGNFNSSATNTIKFLLKEKEYTQTTTETYYLWIWLDSAETNSNTMNQTFNIELGGTCTDETPNYVYTADTEGAVNAINIGSKIPNNVTQYNTPEAAMAGIKNAIGSTTDSHSFLKHKIGNGTIWCINGNDESYCTYSTEEECNDDLPNWNSDEEDIYSCIRKDYTDSVSESYAGFVITPDMATANPGVIPGTYYLKGSTNRSAYNDNKSILLSAFDSKYCHDYALGFSCSIDGLNANINFYGNNQSNDGINYFCYARGSNSYCYANSN